MSFASAVPEAGEKIGELSACAAPGFCFGGLGEQPTSASARMRQDASFIGGCGSGETIAERNQERLQFLPGQVSGYQAG